MFSFAHTFDKIAELCQIIDVFSADAHFDYQIVRFAQSQRNLLERGEQFDIKDEELFNQLETFLSGYKELINSLGINSQSLSVENMQELGDLVNTLETRYERLITNPILDVSPEEGFDEDFDPAEFREFVADVMEDANARFQAASGLDVDDLSALKKVELVSDLNQEALDRGDDKMRWSGPKLEQALKAREKHLEMIKFRRKFAKNTPEYLKLLETSRRNYQAIMADPERREAYRQKARERKAAHWGRLGLTPMVETQKGTFAPQKQLEKWRASYEHLQRLQTMFQTTGVPAVERLRGGILQLGKNIINVRMGVKKTITGAIEAKIKHRLQAEELTTFGPLIERIAKAKSKEDIQKIKEDSKVLFDAMQKRFNDLAKSDPKMIEFEEKAKLYVDLVDDLSDIHSRIQKLSSRKTRPEEMPDLQQLRVDLEAASDAAKWPLEHQSSSPSKSFIETLKILHPILETLSNMFKMELSK